MQAASIQFPAVLIVVFEISLLYCDQAGAQSPDVERAHAGEVLLIRFSPDGKTLASAGLEGGGKRTTLKLWNVSDRREIRSMSGHRANVWMFRFADSGKTLISRDEDGVVIRWNTATGREVSRDTRSWHSSWPGAAAFKSDGSMFALGDLDINDGRIVRYKTHSPFNVDALLSRAEAPKKSDYLVGHAKRVWALSFSPDDKRIASGDVRGTFKLWDAETGKTIVTWQDHKNEFPVSSMAFSPDGRLLASTACAKEIKLWDGTSGKLVHTISTGAKRDYPPWPLCIAFSPDGKSIVSGGMDGRIKYWKVP